MNKPLSHIKPSPINEEIYSSSDLSDLELSLEQNGQLEPIVINSKNFIISGHRRYYSMRRLGWKECEVRVRDYDNEIISLIEHNKHRVKSVTDIHNEYRLLEKEYKKQLGSQGSRTDLKKKNQFNTMVEISKNLNVGTTKLKQIKSIYNYEPELLDKINKGDESVNSAYKYVQKKYMKSKKDTYVDDSKVEEKLIKYLKKEQPSSDVVVKALKSTYPYSLLDYSSLSKKNEKIKKKRTELIDHMNFLKSLDEREIVIYKKLKEIQNSKFDEKDLKRVSRNVYQFSNLTDKNLTLDELNNIKPVLHRVKDFKEFNILRILTHSMEWSSNPGRNLKYIVKDLETQKYLGVITLGSDVTSIQCRDEYIGWNKDNKFKQKKLNNTCIASTIVPVQPMGYNFLLGKMISCLCSSTTIRDDWKKQYGDTLVGVTTTSLYGSFSMYNSVPLWKKVGSTNGKIVIKPDSDVYGYWNDWVKENYPDEFYHATHSTGPKQNVINLIFRKLGISPKQFEHEQQKGVYFMNIYENTREFLRGEIGEKDLILKDNINKGREFIINWWLKKSIKRYETLLGKNQLHEDVLWYENMDSMGVESWLKSRGVNGSIQNKENKIDPIVVDRMFRKVGIDKNKFYDSLILMGKDGLKTKKMKDEWSKNNPTRNYCYVVSEFLYKYIAPQGVKHFSIKIDEEDYTHHYLKWDDGTIIDLTAEQFEDYSKIDYSKSYTSGFIGKGVSKRTQQFAELMGYK